MATTATSTTGTATKSALGGPRRARIAWIICSSVATGSRPIIESRARVADRGELSAIQASPAGFDALVEGRRVEHEELGETALELVVIGFLEIAIGHRGQREHGDMMRKRAGIGLQKSVQRDEPDSTGVLPSAHLGEVSRELTIDAFARGRRVPAESRQNRARHRQAWSVVLMLKLVALGHRDQCLMQRAAFIFGNLR